MINRGNWLLVKKYLRYRKEVDQISDTSMRLEKTWLNHLIIWADDKSFEFSPNIRPSFPQHIVNYRPEGRKEPLSNIYIKKVIGSARRFLEWLTVHQSGYSTNLKPYWLVTLKPPRMNEEPKEHEAVTIEEIIEIAKAPTITMREKRIKAAAVFWFLSGIRIGAFVTLPIKAVNIKEFEVKQWPSLGVKTKNGKHETTYLLNIPELRDVIKEWDNHVRAALSPEGFWFAPFSPLTGTFDRQSKEVGKHRDCRTRKDLRVWLNRAGLKYHSPHKFRHGFAVYAVKKAKEIGDLKTISQNLMHSSLKTTDGIYGVLSENDRKKRIINLGKSETEGNEKDIIKRIEKLEKLMKKEKENEEKNK